MIFSPAVTPSAAEESGAIDVAHRAFNLFLGGRIMETIEVAPHESPLGMRAVQPISPFFDDLRTVDGRVDFKDINILRALKIEPGAGTSVLAECRGSDLPNVSPERRALVQSFPAILTYTRGKGRVMVWTLSPGADDSNLPLMPEFLSLLHRGVSVLCNAQPQTIERKAGQPVILDFSSSLFPGGSGKSTGENSSLTIYDPDGGSHDAILTDGRLMWRETGRAGIYRLSLRDKLQERPKNVFSHSTPPFQARENNRGKFTESPSIPSGFSIVPDTDESLADYLTAGDAMRKLASQSHGQAVYILASDGDFTSFIESSRQGLEFFGIFIFAALLMVLAEAMLANMLGTPAKKTQIANPAASQYSATFHGVNESLKLSKHSADSHPKSKIQNPKSAASGREQL